MIRVKSPPGEDLLIFHYPRDLFPRGESYLIPAKGKAGEKKGVGRGRGSVTRAAD